MNGRKHTHNELKQTHTHTHTHTHPHTQDFFMILFYPSILHNSTTNSEFFSPFSFLEMKINVLL